MIEKASIYTMNALNKLSELWHNSVNHKARPVVEGEHDKSWNDHGNTKDHLKFLGYFSGDSISKTDNKQLAGTRQAC